MPNSTSSADTSWRWPVGTRCREQIAKDFGISESCVFRREKLAETDEGVKPGVSSTEQAELREARKRIKNLEQENYILPRAAACHSARQPKMTYPLVREQAAQSVPVAVTCWVLKFSQQGLFTWLQATCSRRDCENAYLTNAILNVHRDDPAFGYGFIADELERMGLPASENRAYRLAREQRVWSVIVKKKHRYKVPVLPVCDDLVQRDFSADRPYALWLTDITEHPTAWNPSRRGHLLLLHREGRLLESNRRLLLRFAHAGRARGQRSAPRRRTSRTRRHDRPQRPGSKFPARSFVDELRGSGLKDSMSRVGAAGDHAAIESFHSLTATTCSIAGAGR